MEFLPSCPGQSPDCCGLHSHESQLLPGNLGASNFASSPKHSSPEKRPQPLNEDISVDSCSPSNHAPLLCVSLSVSREYSLGTKTKQNPFVGFSFCGVL